MLAKTQIVPLDTDRVSEWQKRNGPYCTYRRNHHRICEGQPVEEMAVTPNTAVAKHSKEIVRPLCKIHAKRLRDRLARYVG